MRKQLYNDLKDGVIQIGDIKTTMAGVNYMLMHDEQMCDDIQDVLTDHVYPGVEADLLDDQFGLHQVQDMLFNCVDTDTHDACLRELHVVFNNYLLDD